jgi:hypothetical protein
VAVRQRFDLAPRDPGGALGRLDADVLHLVFRPRLFEHLLVDREAGERAEQLRLVERVRTPDQEPMRRLPIGQLRDGGPDQA